MAETKAAQKPDPNFPKWLHKGWKATEKQGLGHHEPTESKLAHSAEEAKELAAKGFTEEPPKPPAKKEEPKKE